METALLIFGQCKRADFTQNARDQKERTRKQPWLVANGFGDKWMKNNGETSSRVEETSRHHREEEEDPVLRGGGPEN
ncbi:unnamed protein product [Caenorhabditis auriculariae]|uniref:Uncharacterized protein n=1 Tax=Caenorhabditis auriculariae TaxID=2777116 RepID=A0A8S1HH07_9PELO|nr:unnamed protein product [Caenorhabditis auriculariae]